MKLPSLMGIHKRWLAMIGRDKIKSRPNPNQGGLGWMTAPPPTRYDIPKSWRYRPYHQTDEEVAAAEARAEAKRERRRIRNRFYLMSKAERLALCR
jgi:hypothetical protein